MIGGVFFTFHLFSESKTVSQYTAFQVKEW